MSTDQPALRSRPEMPSFFHKDHVGRDEFLSQLGHLGDEHRAIFSRLCDLWEPDILYSQFLKKTAGEYMNADTLIVNLMSYMERGSCGLISVKAQKDKLVKNRIILTERDSVRFWYWRIENLWQECLVSESKHFPCVSDFKDLQGFPAEVLERISLRDISPKVMNAHADEIRLYSVEDDHNLILTPALLKTAAEAAKFKLRTLLADSPLLSVLARLLGTIVSDLSMSLSGNDVQFWNRLTGVLSEHREELMFRKAGLNDEIFTAARILFNYTVNELVETEQKRERNAEQRKVIKSILEQMEHSEAHLYTEAEFSGLFTPYSGQWPGLEEKFTELYVSPSESSGLSTIIKIGGSYVYRDHLYPLFKAHLKIASLDLRNFYMNKIERLLRIGNRDRFTAFSGMRAYRQDIRERLALDHNVLAEMLFKPHLMSDAIIHHLSKIMKVADINQIKSVLHHYFKGDSLRFKESEELLNIPPVKMFEAVYRSLGLFRRMILRLFGRYQSYVDALKISGDLLRFAGNSPSEQLYADPGYSRRQQNYGNSQSAGSPSASRRREHKEKLYSAKQQDRAWEDFRSAYKGKKKE